MTHGSRQLRVFRCLICDGATLMTACARSGLSLPEGRLTLADDAAKPPPPEAYEPLKETETMAKKAKPGDSGVINITDAKAVVRNSVPAIINLKKKRKEITDEINALRSNVKAVGIPKAALDLAIRMREIDPEDRAAHDQGYAIARDALGLKIQLDFLEEMDHPTPEKAAPPVELKGAIAKAAHAAGMIPDAVSPAH